MAIQIPINLVFEDALSEAVLRRILKRSRNIFVIGHPFRGRGYGYIKRKLGAFNNAARSMPYLVLADCECECPPAQIEKWLSSTVHPNLLFRIAVQEIESWLLADRLGIASFLGVSATLIPQNVDQILNPKQCMTNLARRSPRRRLRQAIAPRPGSTAQVGPGYNGQLCDFVANIWNVDGAAVGSPSLRRCLKAVDTFRPTWPSS